jgi:DNA repair protein RecO (recombination protein O)
MTRFEGQPAYILHSRPYRETSLLLEILTQDYGRIAAIARGVNRPKTRTKGLLQPFVPLLVSCFGRGELLTLKEVDARERLFLLKGRRLLCAFYMNELCMRLLHRWDPNQKLYCYYENALLQLGESTSEQIVLRLFEKSLLTALGYELPLLHEARTGEAISPDRLYHFDPGSGPIMAEYAQTDQKNLRTGAAFKGNSLLALAHENLEDSGVLSDLKRLLRQVLSSHLGNRPLETRKLL